MIYKHKETNTYLELIKRFKSVSKFYVLDENLNRIEEYKYNKHQFKTCICSDSNVSFYADYKQVGLFE